MADDIIEINGFVTITIKKIILLKALNSPSPRFSFFTVSVIKKESNNPFFRLLDSLSKNAEIS
jgi:hypothetical protein